MFRIAAALSTALLMAFSQPLFAQAKVAVAHFAPFADTVDGTAVDIWVNGDVFLENVKFKEFTAEYTDLAAGTYTIDVALAGTETVAMTLEATVEDGMWYTIYATGDGVKQQLELRVLVDNVDDPAEGNLNIRIVHSAPFSAMLDATQVSIRTAGGDIVNGLVGVPYNVDSGFFQIPTGTYDLKVASNDGYTNYIDALPVELPAGATVTVFAVGDGMNQPLTLIAFPLVELPLRTPVDSQANGMYGLLEGSGVGFVAQPMPKENRLVGTWYQYTEMGDGTFFTFDSCRESETVDGVFKCLTPGEFDGMTSHVALFMHTDGGTMEGDMVQTMQIGEILFDFTGGCNDTKATVTLTDQDPVMYSAVNLTRPFGCPEDDMMAQ